jgi:4-hydroxyphenylpyruvate dioxygenase
MTSSTYGTDTMQENDPLQIIGLDHVEFYVGNAYQSASFYRLAFGFTIVAYAGLETGVRDRQSFVIKQGSICIVLTSALRPDSPIAEYVKQHGDSVSDIALNVRDAELTFHEAVKRGAKPVIEPTEFESPEGSVIRATIATCGETLHSIIERKQYSGPFLPSFQSIINPTNPYPIGLEKIDHIAISVERGKLDEMVEFYKYVLGMEQTHNEDVSTEYSSMHSRVVQNRLGSLVFPILEPGLSKRRSQIEEFLEFHKGTGVQHLAFQTEDIASVVKSLRRNGIDFLSTPDIYYDSLEERIGKIDMDLELLHELNILADRDRTGYLFQIFTKPITSRPTAFIEIIERNGATGFGGGNIKALFESIEREQALRETL